MATPGFYFSRLEAHGRGVETAVLELTDGLNVVSGASDTGKSYLVHCLNFMTGAKTPPKSITESEGYELLLLELMTWSGEVFTLQRSLRGGDFRLYRSGIDDLAEDEGEVLKATRSKGSNTSISEFLLELSGMDGVQLRTNAEGKTRPLSFRDVVHLAIVTEERIYTEGSPVRATGQYVNKTVEESYFRYLLTGVDDSSVVTRRDEGDTEGHRQARLDVLHSVAESLEDELLKLTDSPDEMSSQLQKLKASLGKATTAIALDRERLRQEQAKRQQLWEDIHNSIARTEVLKRLLNRFELLNRHYDSDLRRLRAMAEIGGFMSQMPQVDCPLCGTENPWGSDDDLDQIQRACKREVQRINLLQEDLRSTAEDLQTELTALERGISRSQRSYQRVTKQIEEDLLPAEEVTKDELTSLLDAQSRLERAQALSEQLQRIRHEIENIESTPARPRSRGTNVAEGAAAKTSETDEFCQVVEKLLRQWHFPDTGRVTFSETNQDLVINGKDRASHGKGIRALSYAAFIVGLLRFCRKKGRSHPGFVVLDSPLVAYREPDSQKSVQEAGVKEGFYRSLARRSRATQIIVFENEDPPSDLREEITYIHFSGDKKGRTRTGFFPKRR